MQQFEPMSIGQILDRTFRLYRQNFVRFVAIAAVVQVPIAIVMLALQRVLPQTAEEGASPRYVMVIGLAWAFIGAFFAVISKGFGEAALLKSVSESYLGRSVTVSQAYRFILPKLGAVVCASILVFLVIVGGILLLVVPGIIFSLWFSLTMQAIVLENLKATDGMSRSMLLVRGNLGKVFLVGLVVLLIASIVNLLFWGAGSLAASYLPGHDPTGPMAVTQLVSMVGEVLVMPISAAAMILLYYDLRIRKEAFDLEMLAESLGSKWGPSDAAAPAR